jgi:6,7-dimethyl-8-ribityllumazine synthase
MTVVEGQLDARELRIGIVVARFNSFVTERLVEGATDCIIRHGGSGDAITLVRVPGSWEIPLAVQHLAASGRVDGIVALGAVIRGSTPHFDYVAAEVSKGIASIGLERQLPITFGVLTTDSIEQAVERAGTKAGNKGWDAALGVIEMVGVTRELARLA